MNEFQTKDENIKVLTVSEIYAGERIDRYLSNMENISRSMSVKLIEGGSVTINSKVVDKNYKLKISDKVVVIFPEPENDEVLPEPIPIDIIYEDSDVIVINKSTGMIVHPAPGIYKGTLVNALLYHCKESLSGIGGVVRPGIVHRLDKDTSGLMVVAKNDHAHITLSEQLKVHDVSRVYYAVVVGNIKEDTGTVNKPIGRHPIDRKKMAVISNPEIKSREAITHYEVIERYTLPTGRFTLVKCVLETGRTHQIRVHMASLGHPLLGDDVYCTISTKFKAQNADVINGQCLHAKELKFNHPKSGELLSFASELPHDMHEVIERLRKASL